MRLASAGGSRPTDCATPTRSNSPVRGRGQHHPAPAPTHRPRHHVGIPPGHRSERDHRRRPLRQTTRHLGHRRTRALTTSRGNDIRQLRRPPARRAGRSDWLLPWRPRTRCGSQQVSPLGGDGAAVGQSGPSLAEAPPREAPKDRACRHRPSAGRELLRVSTLLSRAHANLESQSKLLVRFQKTREDLRSQVSPSQEPASTGARRGLFGARRWVRLTYRGLPAALVIRRSCSSRPSTLGSGGGAAASEGAKCAAFCRAWSVACVTPPAGPVQRGRGFGRGARTMTGLRADRLDRTVSEIEAGRPNVTLP